MNWKRIAGWAAAIIAVVILVAFATLKLLVSPESVAMLVIPQIEEAFERDVTFSGVELSYFPKLGVRVSEVEIKNDPDFGGGPFARIAQINANVGFFSLLGGDPQIDELEISGWEMLLQVDPLGRRNFLANDDTLVPPDTAQLKRFETEPLCTQFHMHGGRLLYRNDSTDVRLVLAGIDLTYTLTGERSDRFSGSFTIDSLLTRNEWFDLRIDEEAAEATFEGSYKSDADSLTIRNCLWRVDLLRGRLDGTAGGLHAQPYYTLHGLSERTTLEESADSRILALLPSFDKLGANGNLRWEVTYSDTVGDTLSPQVRGEINLTDFTFSVPGSEVVGAVRFAEANFNHRTFSLYTEGAAIGQTPALLRLTINDFSDPTYSGEINLVGDAKTLLGTLGLPDHVEVGGFVEASVSGFIRPTDIEAGRIFGSLLIEGLSYHDSLNAVGIDNFHFDSRFGGNEVDLPAISLAIGENEISLSGEITEFPLLFASGAETLRKPVLDLNVTSSRFDFDTLTTINSILLFGESDTSNVWSLVENLLHFNVSGTVAVDTGRFWGVPFTDLGGKLSGVNKIVYSDSAHVNAFGGRLEGEVVMEFTSLYEPELEIDLRARNISAEQFLGFYTDLGSTIYGRTDLNCSVTGHGMSGDALRRSLTMKGNFTIRDGNVSGLALARAFESELGIYSFRGSQVSAVACEFMLANESLRFNRLGFDSGPTQYEVSGIAGLDGSVALDVRRSLNRAEINDLSSLPDARSLMPSNPRVGIFRITGNSEDGYRIAIDSFR